MRRIALLAALALTGCDQPAPPDAVLGGASVTAQGFTLTSVQTTLPADDMTLPPGPGVELVSANCTACHSPAMILTQPALKPDQWLATIKKMREIYHAPIAERDGPAIAAYLSGLTGPATKTSPPAR